MGLFDLKVILLLSLAYGINRFWLKKVVRIPVVSYLLKCHFNDFLAGICILAYINLLRSFSRYRHRQLRSGIAAVLVCFFCGLLWEYILPAVFPHGTSDVWDLVAYILGGAAYIVLRNRFSPGCAGNQSSLP